MKNEPWWQHVQEDENYDLRAMLMYLIDVLRDKEQNSYESACNYVVEVFRYDEKESEIPFVFDRD